MTELQSNTPTTMIHCDLCGEASIYGTKHRCALSARQQRKIAAARQQQAAEAARRTAPQPCPDCSGLMTPGRGHYCAGRPVDKAMAQAADFQVQGLVSALKQAGYTVEKQQ